MKTIYITLFFLFVNLFNSTAQEFKIDTKNSFEIPGKFKSKEVYSDKKVETYTYESKYFKEFNGYITAVFDASGKVVLINAPEGISKSFFTKGGTLNKNPYPQEVIENCSRTTSGFWAFLKCVKEAL